MGDIRFIKAKCIASSLADAATAAYWNPESQTFHENNVRQNFAELAELLGYQIEKLPPNEEVETYVGEALA